MTKPNTTNREDGMKMMNVEELRRAFKQRLGYFVLLFGLSIMLFNSAPSEFSFLTILFFLIGLASYVWGVVYLIDASAYFKKIVEIAKHSED